MYLLRRYMLKYLEVMSIASTQMVQQNECVWRGRGTVRERRKWGKMSKTKKRLPSTSHTQDSTFVRELKAVQPLIGTALRRDERDSGITV